MSATHDDHSSPNPDRAPSVTPRPWAQTRMQPRARPQWDPVEVARHQLDEMERARRLHGRPAKKH